jgi:restriction system protein
MTEISPQRIGDFLRIVIVRLWNESTGLPAREVLAHIPQAIPLTDFELEQLPSTHTPRYERAVRLAAVPYGKAGWLVKNKDRWFLTEEGKRACKSFVNADEFYQEAGRLFNEWRASRSLQALVTEEAGEMAWEQIRGFLQEMRPYEFQMLVEELLRAMGYHLAWAAPPEKERGLVNFVIHSEPLGLSLPRIKVHVLHSGQPVMLEGLQAFLSVLGPQDTGIFISSGGFTGGVLNEARAQNLSRLTLINLENFFDLWVEYYEHLTASGRQRFPLKPIYFLSPLE